MGALTELQKHPASEAPTVRTTTEALGEALGKGAIPISSPERAYCEPPSATVLRPGHSTPFQG